MLMRSRREHVPHSRSLEEVLGFFLSIRVSQFLKRRTSLSLPNPPSHRQVLTLSQNLLKTIAIYGYAASSSSLLSSNSFSPLRFIWVLNWTSGHTLSVREWKNLFLTNLRSFRLNRQDDSFLSLVLVRVTKKGSYWAGPMPWTTMRLHYRLRLWGRFRTQLLWKLVSGHFRGVYKILTLQ